MKKKDEVRAEVFKNGKWIKDDDYSKKKEEAKKEFKLILKSLEEK